jgi:hypothetical protein
MYIDYVRGAKPTNMNKRTLIILSCIAYCIGCFLIENIQSLALYSFISIVVYSTIGLLGDRRIRMIYIWQAAFCYIIIAELLAYPEVISSHSYGLTSTRYLLVANALVIIGYVIKARPLATPQLETGICHYPTKFPSRYAYKILVTFFLMFFLYALPIALKTIGAGRSGELFNRTITEVVVTGIMLGLGMVLPATSVHLLTWMQLSKSKKTTLHLLSALSFLTFFAVGTRFYVLFCVGGYLVMAFKSAIFSKLRARTVSWALALLVAIGSIVGQVTNYRVSGYENAELSALSSTESGLTLIGKFLSPEGVVKINADLIDFFNRNDHLYGASTSFILYFWIPRELWPTKPNMIGYWLVREYESGFADGHSVSVGFFGDLYADFRLGVFPVMILTGYLLAKLEKRVLRVLGGPMHGPMVLAAMTYPAVFFFVRSPLTTVMNFIGIYLAYKLLDVLLYRRAVVFQQIRAEQT